MLLLHVKNAVLLKFLNRLFISDLFPFRSSICLHQVAHVQGWLIESWEGDTRITRFPHEIRAKDGGKRSAIFDIVWFLFILSMAIDRPPWYPWWVIAKWLRWQIRIGMSKVFVCFPLRVQVQILLALHFLFETLMRVQAVGIQTFGGVQAWWNYVMQHCLIVLAC